MLISIFGPDGAGKTTQIKKLLNLYSSAGLSTASINDKMSSFDYQVGSDLQQYYQYFKQFDVIHTRFRLHSTESDQIMSILEVIPPGTDIKLTALSAYVSYYSYVQWNKYVLEPLLNDGKLLICDKYFYDDIATKSAFGCPYKWLSNLHYDTPRPTIAFYLQLDGQTLRERNKHRGDGRIVHYHDPIATDRLLYYYEQIVIDEQLVTINGNQSRETILTDILSELEKYDLSPTQYYQQLMQKHILSKTHQS